MTTLLVLLLQTSALLALGFLALRFTQKRGPAVQTVVGRATLSGTALLLLLLPLSGRVAPVWRLPASPPAPILGSHTEGNRKDAGAPLAAPLIAPAPVVPSAPLFLPAPPAMPASPKPSPAVPATTPAAAGPAVQEGAGTAKGAASPSRRSARSGVNSAPLTALEAGFPTLLLFFWLAVCQCHLIRLRRTACPVTDSPALDLLAALAPHPPLLLTHPSVCSPFLAGCRRPAIFLPPTYTADFDTDALRAIFVHELAHLGRRDNLWTLAARLLTAVLWFQPLLWLLCRKMEQISEDACDQAVLAQNCPPRAYAACLLSLAERPSGRRERALSAGVAPFRSSVGRRISHILTLGVPAMSPVTLRLRLSIAALTLAAALGGASLVSSAPAQTQPKPTSLVGIWLGPSWGGERSALEFSPDGQIDQVSGWPADNKKISHWLGTYTVSGSQMTWRLTHLKVGDAAPAYATSPTVRDLEYRLSGDTLTMHLNVKNGWTQISHRIAAYTPEMLGITPDAPAAAPVSADSHLTAAQRVEYAAQENDMTHLEVIGLAITKYAENHNEQLPDADHWMDQIQPYLSQPGVYCDPFRPGPKQHGYAFNRNCSRQLLTAFPKPDQTVIVFDSPFAARNASNTGETVRTWNKPTDKALIPGSGFLFVNGVARWYGPDVHPLFSLQGNPSADFTARAARAERLRQITAELAKVRGELAAGTRDSSPLGQAQFLAGLTPVQGPGVVVTLRDSKKPFSYPKGGWPAGLALPNIIHDSDISLVVNELRAAGAEAIAVNNQRLVATSAVRSAGPALLINNVPQGPPFVIKAIGNPKTLMSALNMPGGIASQIAVYDKAMFAVQQAATLTLPAYTGADTPRYARPAGAGAQAFSALPKRSFSVNFQVPSTGVQAVQVYVRDAAGRHLSSSKTYAPGTRVNLPVQAVGRTVSFQIYDNGRLTKTQQIVNGSAAPAPIIKPATADTARMHTIVGYGLVSFMLSKHLYCHAVEHSEASRLGVPIETNSEIIGVNRGSVPKTAEQFVAICRAMPPLRLLLKPVELKNFTHKTQSVTFQTKAPFTVVTDAARAEELGQGLKSAQADAATAKAALVHANEQLTTGIHVLIPQAPQATLAKALNLERQLGWSMDRMKGATQGLARGREKHNPEIIAGALEFEKRVRVYLDPEQAEEARLFPQTAESRRQLAQLHVLAEQMGNMQITVVEKQIQATVIADLLRQRSPDVSL